MFEGLRSMIDIPPIVVSILCIMLTCAFAHFLRVLVLRTTPRSPMKKLLLNDAIAAAELCGCCFELIIVADNFGTWVYAVFLFLLTIYWGRQWGDSSACPYTYLEDMIEGRSNYGVAILRTLAGLVGAFLVFKYIQMLWGWELVSTHKGRGLYGVRCTADLQVPVLYGFLIELGATFLCRISSKTISELEPDYGSAYDSFIGTSLVVAAFDTSGGYFNPLLATGLKFGCRGHTKLQFFVVYWLGSSLGAAAAAQVFKMQAVRDVLVSAKNTFAVIPAAEEETKQE